jgi:hypothetical protein
MDFTVFVAEGNFRAAWDLRHRLHVADAHCWDHERPPGDRDVAAHRWLTTGDIALHEIERLYGELKLALRAHGQRVDDR